LQFESRLSDWNSIPLRQAPQLLQGEPAAAASLGDQNARPNALRTWITQACLCTHRRQPIGGPPSSIPSRRSASPGGTNAVNALKCAPDVDLTWAALNSLVLALGTLIPRGRVERQLPEAVSPSRRRV